MRICLLQAPVAARLKGVGLRTYPAIWAKNRKNRDVLNILTSADVPSLRKNRVLL
jgi:hypothetical protein